MSIWAVAIGFAIAYFGGSMAAIVYQDAKGQGKRNQGAIFSACITVLSGILFTLAVNLIR